MRTTQDALNEILDCWIPVLLLLEDKIKDTADPRNQQQQKSPDQPVVVAEEVVVEPLGVWVGKDDVGADEEGGH